MTTPVRPLFISPFGWYGGQEVFLMRLLESLGPEFAPRTLLLGDGPFADRLRDDGVDVEVEELPGRRALVRFPLVARRLARRLAPADVSLIHANGNKAALLAVPLARRLGVPLVWMKHDHVLDGAPTRFVAGRCDRVVCVSEFMAAGLPRRLRDRVAVITPGVEPAAAIMEVDDTEPLVLCAGRLHPDKGFAAVLDAVALLRGRGMDVRVDVIGPTDRSRPEHRAELERAVVRLGLEDHARVLGWVDDLRPLYDGARVVAIASRAGWRGSPGESAGLVLMEAMARGRPVVGPRVPGVAEVVGDAGTLVDPPDASGLAAALAPYLADRELATATGRRGRKRIAERFTWRATVDALSALYRELAAGR
jgi:glycosyltransferase involved in cell wall biosynthesis